MHDSVDSGQLVKQRVLSYVTVHESKARVRLLLAYVLGQTHRKIVDTDHLVTVRERSGEQIGAEKTGHTGYQNARGHDRHPKHEEVNKTWRTSLKLAGDRAAHHQHRAGEAWPFKGHRAECATREGIGARSSTG